MHTWLIHTSLTDEERLEDSFTSEEIIALVWLQHHYQTGGSDRAVLLRHWESLRILVLTGKLEV